MVFKEQEQITKNYLKDLLTEQINYQVDNLMREIVRFGIQQFMDMDWDNHIGVGSYESGKERQNQRNGYKSGRCTFLVALCDCAY